MVEFPVKGGSIEGYEAVPQQGGGPGVVVIQEWWGLVDHIKDVCERFAAAGFVALAPDLYHGKTTKSPDEAGKLMMALRIDEAEKEISGAVDYLLKHDAVTSKKIGVVGFCMGGALSIYTATKNPSIGASVVFYGGHPNVKPNLQDLHAPVLGLYAEKDVALTSRSVQEFENKSMPPAKPVEVVVYSGTDHAFFNDSRPEVYNEKAAADAWQRTTDFLHKHLGEELVKHGSV